MKRRFFHFAGILAMTVMIQGLAEAQVRKAKSKPAVKAPVIRQQKDRGSAVPATQAGTGGPAIAIGGNGGKGSVLGKGGSGGNAIAVGGKGGDVLGDRGTAGKGGSALAIGGRGGDAQGGVGGRGGDAIAFGGNGGNVLSRTPLLGDRSNRSDSKNADSKSAGTTLINTGTINNTAGNGGNGGPGGQGGNGGNATVIVGDNNTVINGNITINAGSRKGARGRSASGGGSGGGFGGSGGGSGGGYAVDGAPGIAVASNGADGTVIGSNGSPAVAVGKDGKDGKDAKDAKESKTADQPVVQTQRYLKLQNDSGSKLKVWVQYRTLSEQKVWVWVPAAPEDSDKALTYDLEPGQSLHVAQQGEKIAASRVRLWAQSEIGKWLEYKDADLWLVPEEDQNGQHNYMANEIKTFTFVFPRKEVAK